MVGKIGSRLIVKVDDRSEIGRRHRDVLVLAKLPVGDVQIGKVDSAKYLVLSDGLRIIQGSGNKPVDIDVLDVEGLSHVAAAHPQKLGDLLLIMYAVELRPYCVRRA